MFFLLCLMASKGAQGQMSDLYQMLIHLQTRNTKGTVQTQSLVLEIHTQMLYVIY